MTDYHECDADPSMIVYAIEGVTEDLLKASKRLELRLDLLLLRDLGHIGSSRYLERIREWNAQLSETQAKETP